MRIQRVRGEIGTGMFIVEGYTACCGKPTRKDGDYDVFLYVDESGQAFVDIRCGRNEECKGEIAENDKSERGIIAVQRNPGQRPQSISAAFLRSPHSGNSHS